MILLEPISAKLCKSSSLVGNNFELLRHTSAAAINSYSLKSQSTIITSQSTAKILLIVTCLSLKIQGKTYYSAFVYKITTTNIVECSECWSTGKLLKLEMEYPKFQLASHRTPLSSDFSPFFNKNFCACNEASNSKNIASDSPHPEH